MSSPRRNFPSTRNGSFSGYRDELLTGDQQGRQSDREYTAGRVPNRIEDRFVQSILLLLLSSGQHGRAASE